MVEDEAFVFVLLLLLLLFGGLGDGERRLASRRGDCGEVREGVAVLDEFVIVFFVVIGGGGSSNGFVVVELTGKANGLVDDEAVVDEVAVLAPLGVLVGVG